MRRFPQLLLEELSPNNDIPKDHAFVILKGYFDGGNEADSTQYETVTLGSILGRRDELTPFEIAWKEILKRHGAEYLHVTDALTFNGYFKKGWTKKRCDALILECAQLLSNSTVKEDGPDSVIPGLFPGTVTIVLKDFRKAQAEVVDCHQDANEVLAIHSFYNMVDCSRLIKADFLQLYFDKNEPFRGHILDRCRNRKFVSDIKAQGFDLERRISHIGESDTRTSPALQAADLLTWCCGRGNRVDFDWQNVVLGMRRWKEWLDWDILQKPIPGMSLLIKNRWKFPRRKPTR